MKDIIYHIELHSIEGMKQCFAQGVNPNDTWKEKSLFDTLISMYTRSPRFKECVRAFMEHGLEYEDKILLAILSDDAKALQQYLNQDAAIVTKRVSLDCAYTPLTDVTLLHVCAEFNHLSCATLLVNHGADVNAEAGFDEHGFGGQTPIFHTVNQNGNQSVETINFLLSSGADLHKTVKGIIWGKSYPWETLIPMVNPISYAMMGLLPQMHRNEETIANVISTLLKHAFGIDYSLPNIPCQYLHK